MAVSGQVTSHQADTPAVLNPAQSGTAAAGNLGPVLYEEWSDEVTSQFSNEAHLYLIFDEGAEDELWEGEYYVEPLHTGRNRAGSAGRETDDYPDPGRQDFDQLQIGTTFYRTSGQITSKALLVAEKGGKAAIRALTSDVRGALRDLIQEINVDMYGTSLGVLAEVASVAADAITLVTAFTDRYWEMHGNRFFSSTGRSQGIIGYQLAEATGRATSVARGVVQSTTGRNIINVAAGEGANFAAGDIIIRQMSSNTNDTFGNAADDEAAFGLVGLEQMIDDGTSLPAHLDNNYFNFNRTNNAILDAFVRDMGGAAVDEPVLQDFFDAIGELGGESPDCMLMHRAVRQRVQRSFQGGERRFQPQEFKGGFKGQYLVYNPGDGDVGVYVDKHATFRTIYAVNKNHMKRYTAAPAHLVDYDGSALRQQGNAPVWQWNIEAYFQLACTKPNTCGKLHDVASDETFGVATYRPEF